MITVYSTDCFVCANKETYKKLKGYARQTKTEVKIINVSYDKTLQQEALKYSKKLPFIKQNDNILSIKEWSKIYGN